MATDAVVQQNSRFKVSWMILLAISVMATINHIVLGLLISNEAVLFIGWSAFNLYSTVVLYVPFRRGERWAWYTTWVLVVAFAFTALVDSEIGPYYLAAAAIMAVCLWLTRPVFFDAA